MTVDRRPPSTPRESSPRGRPAPAGNGRPRPTRTAPQETRRRKPPGTQRTLPEPRLRRHTSIRSRTRRRYATSWDRRPMPRRAAELERGDDAVVAEYVITAAAKRATPVVLDVLSRYPRAPKGRTRVAVLMERLDRLLRDPPPTPRVVDDPGPFFHGTKADLRPGDLLTPGWRSNYGSGRQSQHIYLTATRDGAPLAAELARGDGPGRVYRVEPLGRSRTTRTSPTNASPATRLGPTGRPSPCGSSRRSRAGRLLPRR